MTAHSVAVEQVPYPSWVQEFRDHQTRAVQEIAELYRQGCGLVFLDAPTGSGKTLIGEMVRRELGERSLYICTDKGLQDQFVKDFEYASVLKGKANYPTQYNQQKSCDDCTRQGETPCMWCAGLGTCPYQVAKREAIANDLAVLNTSYLMVESNGAGGQFAGRGLVICDEADMLEGSLMGYVEYEVPQRLAERVRLTMPKKAVRKKTLVEWLRRTVEQVRGWLESQAGLDAKVQRGAEQFIGATRRMLVELTIAVQQEDGGEDEDQYGIWVRDYDTKTFKMRPLVVGRYGERYLWRHGEKWLLMSASLVSPGEMVESLGYKGEWGVVSVPMTFPVENRRVVVAPVADMTYRTMQDDGTIEKMCRGVMNVLARHPGESVLVHTGSYRLNKLVEGYVTTKLRGSGRKVFSYSEAAGKGPALAGYKRTPGSVLLGASLERGVDLPGDLCRVQVICKVPFPSMGDKQVSGRMRLPGGDYWYQVQTARELVQMTGRGVRSVDDHCVTYVLDGMFGKFWRKARGMMPAWWNEAVDVASDTRWVHQ